MKKNYFKSFLIMLMLMCSTLTALAVDYALGGFLNGQDVNNYDGNWKFTKSGSNYVLTKTFSKTDNYFWIFDSNGTKYGVDSYTDKNPSTLKQGANEKVGAKGLSTSSATTITFDASTKQISWSTSGGGGTTTSSLYIIGDAAQGWNDASNIPIFVAMTAGTSGEYYYDGLYADREFKFTSQNNWSDASQTIFNDASADNTKSVGATVSKVKNGNDTNAKVSLEEGYVEPIKFFVNTSTKKFWAVATKDVTFDLTASKEDYDTASAPTDLTLTVSSDEYTTGDFIWSSSTDGKNYTPISGVTGNTYTLSGDNVPMITTYFKVKRQKTSSASEFLEDFIVISVYQTCGLGTKGKNLFKITFDNNDSLKTLLGPGSRMHYDAMVKGYTYVKAPGKINDGQYAIVTEPLYCGYGEGGKDECKDESNVLKCIDDYIKNKENERWYRGFRDHTQKKGGANPPFGGMLLINFGNINSANEESGIAFSKVLSETETVDFAKGSTLTFSAFMASAAVKEKPNVTFKPINTELNIQFKATGATSWTTVASLKSEVDFDDNWKRFETSWKITDIDGQFRVVIKNNGSTGDGNDLLIDDISLDLCTPAFPLEFEIVKDGTTTYVSEIEIDSITQKDHFVLRNDNWGSVGEDPCVQLYKVTKDNSGKDKYTSYGSPLTKGTDGYYGGMLSALEAFNDGSDSIELIAVASPNGTCNDYKAEIESGNITSHSFVVFSGSTIIYKKRQCTTPIVALSSAEGICYSAEEMTLPTLSLAFVPLSSQAKYTLKINGEAVLSEIPFDNAKEKQEIDLNTLEYDFNLLDADGNSLLEKDYKFSFEINDVYTNEGVVVVGCKVEPTEEVALKITLCELPKSETPIKKRPGEKYSYNMCKTNVENDTVPFNFLIESANPADKSGLVWLDYNGNLISKDSLYFFANVEGEDSLKVYNLAPNHEPSDTILVRYRVMDKVISSLTLTPESNEIVIGGRDDKTLNVGIQDGFVYNAVWKANGKEITVENKGKTQQTIEKPYIDTEYEVVVTSQCFSDTLRASSTVIWPTVFTPYVKDGRNDAFVKDMNPNFKTQIFTRFGTKIYESDNGWDGSVEGSMNGNAEIAAPGVYYYVVELPDGNIKKGTIEVFKY